MTGVLYGFQVDITEPGSGRPIIKKQKTEKKKV